MDLDFGKRLMEFRMKAGLSQETLGAMLDVSRQTIANWEKNNWKSSDKKEVKNIDLWIRLINLVKSHKSVNWIKVKGHSDNELNNRCDELATSQIKAYKKTSS